jgi:asparagine synthase (glutamine-hydrolysing)
MSLQMDRPVKTFCIGFAEAEFNETPQAAQIAAALGTEHIDQVIAPDVESLFEEVLAGFDEPFADASAIPTYLAAALARDHVGVVLAGDGGDELFGGYTRYHDLLERSFYLPPVLRPVLRRMIMGLPHRLRGRNRLLELNREERGRYAGMVAHPLAPEEGGVARPEIAAASASFDNLLDRWFDLLPPADLLNQASMVDLLSYLPGDILPKIDRTALRHGLITRTPLLDHELIEFAMSLPARLKYREGTGKWILRRAVRDLVPPSALLHPKKGFGVPLRLWFRGPLRHRVDALVSPANLIHEFVDPRALQRIIAEHLSARRDHSPLLWKLMVLEEWLRRCRALPTHGALLPAEVAVR